MSAVSKISHSYGICLFYKKQRL